MGRRKKSEVMIRKNLVIPSSLAERLDDHLYSEIDGKIPVGAWQATIVPLLWALVKKLDRERARRQVNADALLTRLNGKEGGQTDAAATDSHEA